MTAEATFRLAFFVLFIMLLAMRVYFRIRVHYTGGRIMPDKRATRREGGSSVFLLRVIAFIALVIFLMTYLAGMKWIEKIQFVLPDLLRWTGFALGIVNVIFWTWTQVVLDVQWSAQLQLTKDHHLIKTRAYSLYTASTLFRAFGMVSRITVINSQLDIPGNMRPYSDWVVVEDSSRRTKDDRCVW